MSFTPLPHFSLAEQRLVTELNSVIVEVLQFNNKNMDLTGTGRHRFTRAALLRVAQHFEKALVCDIAVQCSR